MPITNPTQAQMFNDSYDVVGQYRTDDDRIPFYNPPDSGQMYLPGEPIIIEQASAYYVYMVQGPIRPGEVGFVVRRFTADFPCDLSASVGAGTPIYWDASDTTGSPAGTAKLFGDVTNGFRIGFASHTFEKHKVYSFGPNGKVLCGTTSSTTIRVVSLDGAALGKGTLSGTTTTTAAPTTTTTAAPTTTTTTT